MVTTVREQGLGANQRYTFARHETFHLREGWLFKGLRAIQENPLALYEPEAHHKLGIGINMLRSLLYWVQATNLVEPIPGRQPARRPLRLTSIGELVLSHDPYIEDIGTLWVIHLQLASNQGGASFWYWVFNEVPLREFTEERLVQEIQNNLVEHGADKFTLQSLKRDARCFRRTYLPTTSGERGPVAEDSLDCPLASLGLLRASVIPGHYRFQIGPRRNLPLLIFAYALYRYRELVTPDQVVLGVDDLRWAPLGPGRLLCLDTPTIVEYLEELQSRTPYAQLVRTAGLNTVNLEREHRAIDFLTEYYAAQGM